MKQKDYFSGTIELLMLFVTANILVFSIANQMNYSAPENQQQEIQKVWKN